MAGDMLARVSMSMNDFTDTMPVNQKLHGTACPGSSSTARVLLRAAKLSEKSATSRPDEVASNSIVCPRAVAAATGRGFKSHQPDFPQRRTRSIALERSPRRQAVDSNPTSPIPFPVFLLLRLLPTRSAGKNRVASARFQWLDRQFIRGLVSSFEF